MNYKQLREKRDTDRVNAISRTFSIRILDHTFIELSRNVADEMFPRVLHYQIVDGNTFEIGDINQNDPEYTIMIFERD